MRRILRDGATCALGGLAMVVFLMLTQRPLLEMLTIAVATWFVLFLASLLWPRSAPRVSNSFELISRAELQQLRRDSAMWLSLAKTMNKKDKA